MPDIISELQRTNILSETKPEFKEFIILNILLSTRGIFIDAFCPAIPISVQPPNIRVQPFCFLVTVPGVPKYDNEPTRAVE